jgi:hypothetical protein
MKGKLSFISVVKNAVFTAEKVIFDPFCTGIKTHVVTDKNERRKD